MALPTQFYAIQDGDRFESLERYVPTDELKSLVDEMLDSNWTVASLGYWCLCRPRSHKLLEQGWKLHIAGTTSTAKDLLVRLVPILVSEGVAFKYCSDLTMVRLSTSKNWNRTSSGKFMTIYPDDDAQAVRLALLCHSSTRELAGPHILTDRPYMDSKVVFYRYGGHTPRYRAEPSGLRVPVITSPDGSLVPDRRMPFFVMPPWLKDPFSEPLKKMDTGSFTSIVLKQGRYRVDGAFRFSSLGGIYHGIDLSTGRAVVIRELRPYLGFSPTILDKEARILQRLEPLGITPAFIDLFEEQTHKFLVQERLIANSLWDRTIEMMWGDPRGRGPSEILDILKVTVTKLVDAVALVHAHRIVLRDLTRTNILFAASDDRLKLIDFELAFELDGSDLAVPGGTFGYRSPQQARNARPDFSDDYFALGAVITDFCTVTAAGLHLHPRGVFDALLQTLRDLGLPTEIADLAKELTDPLPNRRPPLEVVRSRIRSLGIQEGVSSTDPVVVSANRYALCFAIPSDHLLQTLHDTQEGISRYIAVTMDVHNPEHMWPCSPDAFSSNGISFRFGASGVLHYLHTIGAQIPSEALLWLLKNSRTAVCPIGLYSGMAGCALLLLALGMDVDATALIDTTNDERVYEAPGLYEGAAGWALANLVFWSETKRTTYLERALKVAQWLQQSATRSDDSLYWEYDDKVHFGLGRGASGIGLFFLYLYAAQHDRLFLDVAWKAMNFDVSHASWHGDKVLMHDIWSDDLHRMRTPGTFYGTAGVGSAVVRLYAVTKDERLRRFAERCAFTVSSRYTNKLWQDWGLAGCGEFLIDAACFLKDRRFLNAAYYLAEGILPFRMERSEGIAFPGAELLRISCDFGVGSAGIGVFFNRLMSAHTPRSLFPDHLLSLAMAGTDGDVVAQCGERVV